MQDRDDYASKVRAGRKFASKDGQFDMEQLEEVVKLASPRERLQRINQLIDASKEVDGHASDVLLGARPYVLFGRLPPLGDA